MENQLINKLKTYNFKLIKYLNKYEYNEKLYINGIDKFYWSNGNICYEVPYKNGSRNGLFKEYYEDGNIRYEVEYKDSLRNGYWKEYDENNELVDYRIYKDDEYLVINSQK